MKNHFTLEQLQDGFNRARISRVESVSIEHPAYVWLSFGTDSNGYGIGIAIGEAEEEKGGWSWNSEGLETQVSGLVWNVPTLEGVIGYLVRMIDRELENADEKAICGACGEFYPLSHDCDQDDTKETREVRFYDVEIISNTMTIRADSEDEAEEKYDAYFNGDCPCGEDDCSCVSEADDVSHNITDTRTETEILCDCGLWYFKTFPNHLMTSEHFGALLAKAGK